MNVAKDTILAVDDEKAILNSIEALFEDKYNILKASSGESALKILDSTDSSIDCIILDWKLENINGMDFLVKVKSQEKWKDIPVIMQSGYIKDRDSIHRCMKKGVYSFLHKPVDNRVMEETVGSALKDYRKFLNLKKESIEQYHQSKAKIKVSTNQNIKIKLLVIDDNPDDLEIIKRMLGQDMEMRCLTGSEDLIHEVREFEPNCILLDYHLPGHDGINLLRELNSLNIDSEMAIIMLTGHDSRAIAIDSLKNGANDFLIKGNFTREALRKSIRLGIKNAELQKTIVNMDFYDGLTGLPNRKFFTNHLKLQISKTERDKRSFAVLFVDLDNFSSINEKEGHGIGDRLLIYFSQRMKSDVLRKGDIIGRLRADEFAVLVHDVIDPIRACEVAERILKSLEIPFNIENKIIKISASIGICVCPNDGEKPDILLKASDMAMYQAKLYGRNSFKMFDKKMDDKVIELLEQKNNLKKALVEKEFVLYYQPKYNKKKKCVGLEALLRWKHPVRGILRPKEFIHIMETNKEIIPLGYWMIEEVSQQLVKWREKRLPLLPISINFSKTQFYDEQLLAEIDNHLSENGLESGLIEVEITESATLGRMKKSEKILKKLNSSGIKVTVDDFGVGYSPLCQIVSLPIKGLKIDLTLIHLMMSDKRSKALVESTIELAKKLDVEVMAEGIETKEQFKFLTSKGCDIMQGYFLNHPLTIEELEKNVLADM